MNLDSSTLDLDPFNPMGKNQIARPTLLDIAADAGVSRATVSLVIRDVPTVADATRKRVLQSIKKLGYVYHRGAASLRTRQSYAIGLIVSDSSNPFRERWRLSVLDPFCRSHDVPNLFVVGASFFASSAAVNPALTIAAQAFRVADHLQGRSVTAAIQAPDLNRPMPGPDARRAQAAAGRTPYTVGWHNGVRGK